MSVEASSMSPDFLEAAALPEAAALKSWIDENTAGPDHVESVVARLMSLTLPVAPWNPNVPVNPFREDLESQCWFWNRAGGNLTDAGHHLEAVNVWAAHYLSLLSLQLKFHHRYHKGMPLCNIGFAFARMGRTRLAAQSWLLGVIEDALTHGSMADESQSYRNLLRVNVATSVLDQLVTTVETRLNRQSVSPLFPESVVELWLHPTTLAPSEDCVLSVDLLVAKLGESYPTLPDRAKPWDRTLSPFWGFADWVGGILGGR